MGKSIVISFWDVSAILIGAVTVIYGAAILIFIEPFEFYSIQVATFWTLVVVFFINLAAAKSIVRWK